LPLMSECPYSSGRVPVLYLTEGAPHPTFLSQRYVPLFTLRPPPTPWSIDGSSPRLPPLFVPSFQRLFWDTLGKPSVTSTTKTEPQFLLQARVYPTVVTLPHPLSKHSPKNERYNQPSCSPVFLLLRRNRLLRLSAEKTPSGGSFSSGRCWSERYFFWVRTP